MTIDIIDSRDLLKELRDLLEDSSYDYADDPTGEPWAETWAELDTEDRERIHALREVLTELPESTVDSPRGNSWGCTLIPEDGFEDYARELAADIGAVSGNEQWPLSYIDWARAAEALKADYVTVELNDITYYAR